MLRLSCTETGAPAYAGPSSAVLPQGEKGGSGKPNLLFDLNSFFFTLKQSWAALQLSVP